MCGNPQIVVPNHLAFGFQLRANFPIAFSGRFWKGKCRQQENKLPEPFKRCSALGAHFCSVKQVTIGDDGDRRLSWSQFFKSAQQVLRSFLPDVNADVRIQKIARLHHHPLRLRGCSFPRPGISKSSGRPASKSNARTIVPLFSRSTISSPRRKISTSLLFSRNCFGSRNAWLFPDRNTFAVAIFPTSMYIRIVYTNWVADPLWPEKVGPTPPLS